MSAGVMRPSPAAPQHRSGARSTPPASLVVSVSVTETVSTRDGVRCQPFPSGIFPDLLLNVSESVIMSPMSNTEPIYGDVPRWTFTDRMKKSLAHAGLEVEDMAQILGVTQKTIRNYITERTPMKDGMKKQWAFACGVSYDWLEHGIERTPPDDTGDEANRPSACYGNILKFPSRSDEILDEAV